MEKIDNLLNLTGTGLTHTRVHWIWAAISLHDRIYESAKLFTILQHDIFV